MWAVLSAEKNIHWKDHPYRVEHYTPFKTTSIFYTFRTIKVSHNTSGLKISIGSFTDKHLYIRESTLFLAGVCTDATRNEHSTSTNSNAKNTAPNGQFPGTRHEIEIRENRTSTSRRVLHHRQPGFFSRTIQHNPPRRNPFKHHAYCPTCPQLCGLQSRVDGSSILH